MKVLYIAGWGRSGSTILDNILGEVDGFFTGGELHQIWDRGLLQNRPCGCGAPFRECELWTRILREAFGDPGALDVHRIVAEGQTALRTRHLPTLAARGPVAGRAYLDATARLYEGIAHVTGAEVIVDSSKLPSYGYVLGSLPDVELSVVHLVRDPRATSWSWLRRKPMPDASGVRPMTRHHPAHNAVMWNVTNSAVRLLRRDRRDRVLLVRYEDFVQEPRRWSERVLELVGEGGRALPFVDDSAVQLSSNHTVSGNPSRFATGLVQLKPDDEWRTGMHRRDKVLVTALTTPLLSRYGYPVWTGRS